MGAFPLERALSLSCDLSVMCFDCFTIHNLERLRPCSHRTWARLHANLRANPMMLLATCVNTLIDHNVFQNLRAPVARCSSSCVNWALLCTETRSKARVDVFWAFHRWWTVCVCTAGWVWNVPVGFASLCWRLFTRSFVCVTDERGQLQTDLPNCRCNGFKTALCCVGLGRTYVLTPPVNNNTSSQQHK